MIDEFLLDSNDNCGLLIVKFFILFTLKEINTVVDIHGIYIFIYRRHFAATQEYIILFIIRVYVYSWLPILALSVPYEGYSRHAPCTFDWYLYFYYFIFYHQYLIPIEKSFKKMAHFYIRSDVFKRKLKHWSTDNHCYT
jgi:hypothetical protein